MKLSSRHPKKHQTHQISRNNHTSRGASTLKAPGSSESSTGVLAHSSPSSWTGTFGLLSTINDSFSSNDSVAQSQFGTLQLFRMIASSRSSSRRRFQSQGGQNKRPNLSAAARYDVLERAGEGTLFVVYRVRAKNSHAICALKALKSVYSRHERFAPALMDSARSIATLRHPHLATLLEADLEEGTVFLIEGWMPGSSLESRLRRAPLARSESTLLAAQLTDGLAAIHNAGFIHGDVRSRQVLFDAEGAPRWSDIGFAPAFEAARMSLADIQFDAVHYLAPERFDGENASASTDLYALGVTLYRALTGRVPFDGPSAVSIAMRHRNDQPISPQQFNSDCAPELAAAVVRLLSKEPQDRYASADELLSDIAPQRRSTPAQRVAPVHAPIIAAEAELDGAPDMESPQSRAQSTPATGSDEAQPAVLSPSDLRPQAVAASTPLVSSPSTPDADNDGNFDDELNDAASAHQTRAGRRSHGRRELLGAALAFFWLLVAGGLLVGVCYGAYRFWIQEAPPELRVPRYVGMNQIDAQRVLLNSGLQMKVGKEVYNPKKPAGTVLIGDPAPGKLVRKGRVILVTVSRGEEPIRIVDFSELTLNQARTIMNRHGMRLGQVAEQYHDRVPKGYVCGQYPESGEMFRRSDPINLVVSRGPQPSSVAPDPSELPAAPAAPSVQEDETNTKSPASIPNSPSGNADTLVSRGAIISVAIPSTGGPQEVKIVVRDAEGEYTAYQQTHDAGEVIDKPIEVIRSQGATALVRVYVGGKLLRELRV